MFELKIQTGNAAFHDDGMPDEFATQWEVRRILQRTIDDLADGRQEGKCVDYNGNVVGSWALTLEES